MKQKFSGLLFFFLFFSGLVAQSFNVGVLAGINGSQVSGDGYSGYNKAGMLFGLYTDIDVSPSINLQFEINYSEKGSRRNPDTENGDTDFFLLRLDYIEIPLMARWSLNKFKFETGIYYGQLVGEYIEDENGKFSIPPVLNQFKDSDVGGLVGINFSFTEHLIINWRYSNSFIPFRDFDSGANFRFNRGMFHSYLSVSLRYELIGENGK